MNINNIQGYYYKTITVTTSAGVYDYPISANNDLGLPKDAVILGVFCRREPNNPSARSQNARPIVNNTLIKNSFITLKDRATKTIVYRYNYQLLQNPPLFFEKKMADGIDWSNSIIEISPTNVTSAQIVDGEDFEFIIFYAPNDCYEMAENFRIRSGTIYENLRWRYTQIPLQTNITSYNVSKQSNIGIPPEAYIIGLDIRRPNPFQGTIPSGLDNAFLTLKKQTYNFVENLPMDLDDYPKMDNQKLYVPISAIKNKDIGWDTSQLVFTNPAFPTTGETFVLGIAYVEK